MIAFPGADDNTTTETKETALNFTEEDIRKMPKSARKYFRISGHVVHYRKRNTGRYKCSYEIYYSKKPYNNPPISASATTIEEAKKRFIEKLHNYNPNAPKAFATPQGFDAFAEYWFKHFHKRKVAEKTYDHDIKLYDRHVKAAFAPYKIKDMNAAILQDFLDRFTDRAKTTKDLFSIIKQILDCAVKHNLIKFNPIGMCFINDYEQEHGKSLTYEEERILEDAFRGSEWELPIAVIRFTGLRPCEYTTAVLDGEFIKAQNGKRENGKLEYKRIPITPMLRPFLKGVDALRTVKPRMLNNRFKKVLPNHKLYDMRTTFQTRCTECGISDVAIGLFMGNGIGGKLKKAYTDVSDEWLIRESNKLLYDVRTQNLPIKTD